MDPISMIGVVGSVVRIVDVISKNVHFLCCLQTKYRKADLTLSLLIGQLSTLKAALNQISEWIDSELNTPKHEQLVEDLTTALHGCHVLISLLDARVDEFHQDEITKKLSPLDKVALLWEESETKEYLTHLNNQINALNLLLTAIQCRSTFEQKNFLSKRASRQIMTLVKEDTSSLLVITDNNSFCTERSVSTRNSKLLDVTFDFDGEILSSKVYHRALRSNMTQNLSRRRKSNLLRRMRVSSPLEGILNLDSDHPDNSNPTVTEKALKQATNFSLPRSPKHSNAVQEKRRGGAAESDEAGSDIRHVEIQQFIETIFANQLSPVWEKPDDHEDDRQEGYPKDTVQNDDQDDSQHDPKDKPKDHRQDDQQDSYTEHADKNNGEEDYQVSDQDDKQNPITYYQDGKHDDSQDNHQRKRSLRANGRVRLSITRQQMMSGLRKYRNQIQRKLTVSRNSRRTRI